MKTTEILRKGERVKYGAFEQKDVFKKNLNLRETPQLFLNLALFYLTRDTLDILLDRNFFYFWLGNGVYLGRRDWVHMHADIGSIEMNG